MSARSVLACWDNSTRGLDASSALEFAEALRLTTNLLQDAAVVAIYQAGERVYEGSRRFYLTHISIRQSNSPLRGSSNLLWPCRGRKAVFHRPRMGMSRASNNSRFSHCSHRYFSIFLWLTLRSISTNTSSRIRKSCPNYSR
jgi:hypothetical protein